MVRCFHYVAVCILALCSSIVQARVLYHGDCELKTDPEKRTQGWVNFCLNADAHIINAQRSKNQDNLIPPTLYLANGDASAFFTPYISFHTRGHAEVYIDRIENKTRYQQSQRDAVVLQIGNNALSRHRFSLGQGRPQTGIDHQQRGNMEYIWGLNKFQAPIVDFASYTYDNQLDLTIQNIYGRLPDSSLSDKQRLFGAGRAMYDIAALEGTRLVFGGYGDGLLRRSINLGILNINGRGDETALEFTRNFARYPYDPKEFKQLIRLSFLSSYQNRSRFKFQYDDIFRQVRIGGIGSVYYLLKNTELETQIGYAKHEDQPRFSHWFAILSVGVRS